MAIESVGSATFAPQQIRNDQAAQASQAEQSRQASEAQEAERPRRDNEAAESQPPQPVVNTQGQVTGKIINTVA
jgi:hypothetical protein